MLAPDPSRLAWPSPCRATSGGLAGPSGRRWFRWDNACDLASTQRRVWPPDLSAAGSGASRALVVSGGRSAAEQLS